MTRASRRSAYSVLLGIALAAGAFSTIALAAPNKGADDLVGAWRGRIQFSSGLFASTRDLEFMYVMNVGGTMTESSNYDTAPPPSPPAYGVWRRVGVRKYELRYHFFQSKADGSNWAPDGYGIISEKLTLSEDGNSFESTIRFDLFDKDGKAASGSGEGLVKGTRIRF